MTLKVPGTIYLEGSKETEFQIGADTNVRVWLFSNPPYETDPIAADVSATNTKTFVLRADPSVQLRTDDLIVRASDGSGAVIRVIPLGPSTAPPPARPPHGPPAFTPGTTRVRIGKVTRTLRPLARMEVYTNAGRQFVGYYLSSTNDGADLLYAHELQRTTGTTLEIKAVQIFSISVKDIVGLRVTTNARRQERDALVGGSLV